MELSVSLMSFVTHLSMNNRNIWLKQSVILPFLYWRLLIIFLTFQRSMQEKQNSKKSPCPWKKWWIALGKPCYPFRPKKGLSSLPFASQVYLMSTEMPVAYDKFSTISVEMPLSLPGVILTMAGSSFGVQ